MCNKKRKKAGTRNNPHECYCCAFTLLKLIGEFVFHVTINDNDP